jgi:hypothetical protein
MNPLDCLETLYRATRDLNMPADEHDKASLCYTVCKKALSPKVEVIPVPDAVKE